MKKRLRLGHWVLGLVLIGMVAVSLESAGGDIIGLDQNRMRLLNSSYTCADFRRDMADRGGAVGYEGGRAPKDRWECKLLCDRWVRSRYGGSIPDAPASREVDTCTSNCDNCY